MKLTPQRLSDWWEQVKLAREDRALERERAREERKRKRKIWVARLKVKLRSQARDFKDFSAWLWEKKIQPRFQRIGLSADKSTLAAKSWLKKSKIRTVIILALLPLPIISALMWSKYGKSTYGWQEWLIAVIVIALAIVMATIAIRTGIKKISPPDSEKDGKLADKEKKADDKKEGKRSSGYSLFVILFIVVVAVQLILTYFPLKGVGARLATGTVDPTRIEYEYSQEDYPEEGGQEDSRYRKPEAVGRAFVITDNSGAMTFRLEYISSNELHSVLFSLDKRVPGGIGMWVQEEPYFSGKWFLKKEQTVSNGYCISFKSDARPDLGWRDAYLKPK